MSTPSAAWLDQTEEAWRELPEKGTAIFLKDGRKIMKPGLTYAEAKSYADRVACLKWVPGSVASYEEMRGGSCSPVSDEEL